MLRKLLGGNSEASTQAIRDEEERYRKVLEQLSMFNKGMLGSDRGLMGRAIEEGEKQRAAEKTKVSQGLKKN